METRLSALALLAPQVKTSSEVELMETLLGQRKSECPWKLKTSSEVELMETGRHPINHVLPRNPQNFFGS